MTWIDDRLAQRKMLEECNELIASSAEEIYDGLWEEIARFVDEAKKKGLPVFTNGKPHERVVGLVMVPGPNESFAMSKELRIKLLKGERCIKAHGPKVDIRLSLDVCRDNVVCLKYGENEIRTDAAAKLILDKFLFPEF
jgi:hypothetical protein